MQEEGHSIKQEVAVEPETESVDFLAVLEGEKQTDAAIVAEARRLAEEIQAQSWETVLEDRLNEAMQVDLSKEERAYYSALSHSISYELERANAALMEEIHRINDDEALSKDERLRLFGKLIPRQHSLGRAIAELQRGINDAEGLIDWESSGFGQNGIKAEPEGYTEEYDEADAEEIEIDFESLLRERAELERRVRFNSEIFGRIQTDKTLHEEGGPLHESKLPELGRRIEERLNAEVLDEEDREPVELFGPDPRVQPGVKRLHEVIFLGACPRISKEDKERVIKAKSYEEVKDIFEADLYSSVTPDNFSRWKTMFKSKAGGYASGSSVVVGEPMPSMHERIMGLAATGELPRSMEVLVHELRHISQFNATSERRVSYQGKPDFNPLFEAQAHYSHPLSGDRKTVLGTIKVLTNKEGSYGFSLDQALKAVSGIEQLNALDFSQSEIADIIAEGRYANDTKRYYAVENAIEKRKRERKLAGEDVQMLGDRLWIERNIKRLRAQTIAQEEILKAIGPEKLQEFMDKKMWPHYDIVFSEPDLAFEKGEDQSEELFRSDAVALWPKDDRYPFQVDDRKGFAISWNAEADAPEARLLHSYVRDDKVIQEIGDVSALSPEERAALTQEALGYMTTASNGNLSDFVKSGGYYQLVEKIQGRAFQAAGLAEAA